MKKSDWVFKFIIPLIGIFIAVAVSHAGQQLVNLPLVSDLVDTKGNLTAGSLIRNSDATYVNTAGALAYSRGTRTNLITRSDPVDATDLHADTANISYAAYSWPVMGMTRAVIFGDNSVQRTLAQNVSITVGTTYILTAYVLMDDGSVPSVSGDSGVGDFSFRTQGGILITTGSLFTPVHIGSNVYRVGGYFTVTVSGLSNGIRKYTGQSTKGFKVSGFQLEALPSGNVIGPDLMDQETVTARASGYTLEIPKVYKIVTQATLDFTTVGAANNTAGTYFIAHTASALGAGDAVSEITAPAKGQFHDIAMLAGSTELVTNGGFETAGGGGADVFGTWTEVVGGTDTIVQGTTPYLGSKSANLTYVDNGTTYVANGITTTAGKLYKLTFYTRGDATVGGRYSIYDVSNSADILAATATGVTSATYTLVTKYFYTPASCTSVSIRLWSPTATGVAYYDYISVRQVQTAWTKLGANPLEIDPAVGTGGALKITYSDNANGAQVLLADAANLTANLVVGETYQKTLKTAVSSGNSVVVEIRNAADTVLASYTETATTLTSHTLYFKADHATTNKLTFSGMGAGEIIWLDDVTMKSVPDLAYLSPGTYTATAGSTATIPAEPRFETNGLLVEGEATNFITYSCDLTNAAWVKSNTTAVKNQTGPDGVASSASLLTASAGNGTALFTVADGAVAANKTYSVWLKRITGTGNIDLTDNNGTNWTTQTITSSWAKYTLAARSQAIPIVGIRIVTNADEVAVCLNHNEISAFATSPIPTNGCPVTRLTEAGSATNGYSWTMSTALKNSLGAASPSRGTMLVDWVPGADSSVSTAGRGLVLVTNAYYGLLYRDNASLYTTDAVNTTGKSNAAIANTPYNFAVRWDSTVAAPTTGKLQLSEKHAGTWAHATAASYDGAFTLGTSLRLAYSNEYPFWIKNVKFYDGWVKDANLNRPKGIIEDGDDFLIFVKKYEY